MISRIARGAAFIAAIPVVLALVVVAAMLWQFTSYALVGYGIFKFFIRGDVD